MACVLLSSPDGAISAANPAAERLLGAGGAGLREARCAALFDQEDPRLAALVAAREATGVAAGAITMRRLDGARFEAEVSTSTFPTEQGPRVSTVVRDVTDRMTAGRALRESEERYRLLMERAPVGIAVHQAGRLVFTNRTGARMLGASSPEALVGRSIEEVIHPDGLAEARDRIRRMLAGEPGLYPAEDRYVRLDGSVIDVEVMAAPLLFGGAPAVQVIVTDITERKHTERALQEARDRREKLESIIDSSPAVAFLWSAQVGEPVSFVSSNLTQFGYRPEDLYRGDIGYADLIHPEDRERVAAEVAAYAAQPECQAFNQEYRVVTASGEVRWVDDRTLVIRDASGGVQHFQGVILDITERVRAQEELHSSEARFERLFELSPMAIGLFRRSDGRAVLVNEAFTRLLGHERSAIIGRTAEELRIRPDPAPYSGLGGAEAPEGAIHGLYASAQTRDGTPLELLTALQAVDFAGEPALMLIAEDVTERRRAERALKESESRFRHVFEAANVGKSVTKVSGEVQANQALADMLGYRHEELIGKSWRDLTPPEDVAEVQAHLDRMLSNQAWSARFLKRYLRKDGGIMWGDVSTVLWRDEEGRPDCFITTVVDISERRRAEEEARLVQRRLEEAMDLARMANWVYEVATDTFTFNDRFYRLYGTSAEAEGGYQMSSMRYAERFIPEDERYLVAQEIMRAVQNPDPSFVARVEHRVVRVDGEVRHMAVGFAAEKDTAGTTVRTFGANQDITNRKRAEAAVAASEAFIRLVMDNLPIGVAVNTVSPKVEFSYLNEAFPRIYHTTREALREPDAFWSAVYEDPEFRAAFRARVLRDCASGDLERMRWEDVPIPVRGKETAYVSAYNVPMPDSNLMISIVQDVTERRRAELERARMEEQFLAAQRMEAVGRLAGGVAHDFNNLLSVIMSYAGFVVSDLHESDPVREDVQEIRLAGERAAALTRQLLAFSRKQVLRPEVLSLNGVLAGLERMLQRLLGEDITLRVYPGEELANVLADPGQVEQVVMNLVVNARDAMPDGGELAVETANVEFEEGQPDLPFGLSPGRYVELLVRDTGCGMDEHTREHIFEPFFTTKEKGKGTGLGLSTVYGIVQQSGGGVSVQSAPGKGTSFQVFLPAVAGRLPERRVTRPILVTGSEVVLVVEDDEAVRRLAERILRSAGYEVLSAASGGDALLVCETHGPRLHLVLADVVMPQMSGPELVRRLTAQWGHLKVLFMSGYTDDALGHHGVLGPDVAFIAKPFTASVLAAKVREVLDGGN